MDRTESTVRKMLTVEAPHYDIGVLSDRGMLPGLDSIRRFGRLPGFTNCKPKYRKPDGLFPFVRLHSYSGQQYPMADGSTICCQDRGGPRDRVDSDRLGVSVAGFAPLHQSRMVPGDMAVCEEQYLSD
jgi:hypothetical protein